MGILPEISVGLHLYMEQLADDSVDAWLFPSSAVRTPLDPSNAQKYYMKERLKKIGMGWLSFQIMRRSHTTHADEAGADKTIMARQQGHSVDVHVNEYFQPSLEMSMRETRKLYDVIQKEREKMS